MIKKYFSKYTGQQIDEAVSALIENNVRIEDLNQEVVDLINSKANEQDLAALQKEIEDNQIKVVEIPIGILQKAVNEEILTAEELAFFTSDYKIYKCAAPLEGAEELGLQMYFVTSVITDNTIALSSHLYNVIIDLATGKVELEASVDLEIVDIKEKISNLESRTNNMETEVSNVSSAASNAEYLAYENQTAIEELKSKSALVRCDSIINDLLLSYTAQTHVQRSLTTEEIEVFSKFINNETLIGVYSYTDQGGECILYKETIATVDEPYLTFSTQLGELKYNVYITLGNTNTIYAWYQNLDMISTNTYHIVEVDKKVEDLKKDLVGGNATPTVVPTSGMIENIYVKKVEGIPVGGSFNYITNQDFIDICNQLEFKLGSSCVYSVFSTKTSGLAIMGYWNSSAQKVEDFWISFYSNIERTEDDNQYSFVGINEEIINAGTQNDLLTEYFSITPFTASKGRVGELEEKVDTLETAIGDINSLLDQINGEVM